ncbi:MAG: DUF6489 family protein, partial [Alphaproteobacteria bacterium]
IKLDINCTPEELRAFLGLPDLGPIHRLVVDGLAARTTGSLKALDPEAMIKAWLGSGAQGLQALQALQAFWAKGGAKGGAKSGAKGGGHDKP